MKNIYLKYLRVLLLAALLLALCFVLSGCFESKKYLDDGEHDFVFAESDVCLLTTELAEIATPTDYMTPCGTKGQYFDKYICTKCGQYSYRPNGRTGVQRHDLGAWEVTKAATCTQAGTETAKCRRYNPSQGVECTYTKTRAIPALGHEYKKVAAKAATCTEQGNTAGEKCQRCGHFRSGEAIPALGHDWGEWAVTTEPTCTQPGVKTRACKREGCGAIETGDVPALGHDWGAASYEWSANFATCTAKRTCQLDGRHVETVTVNPAAGANTATCEAAGRITYTAEFAAPFETQTKTVDTEKLGHIGGTATCTAKAVCTRCQQEYGEVDPTNHNNAGETKKYYLVKTNEGNKVYFNYYCNQCKKLIRTEEGAETETEGVDMEPDVNVPDEGGVVAGGNE